MKKILLAAATVATLASSCAYAAEDTFYVKGQVGWDKLNKVKGLKSKNNVFLGILGKGDAQVVETDLRAQSKCKDSTIPDGKSGAQWCPELRPQDILLFSKGNVDEFECPGPEIEADKDRVTPIDTSPQYKEDPTAPKTRATLLYEVWDSSLRKMQIKIKRT
jgi:hypothetical protein